MYIIKVHLPTYIYVCVCVCVCVCIGTTRGCGWQKFGAYVNLGSYYLVGLPSAIVLNFVIHIGGKAKQK